MKKQVLFSLCVTATTAALMTGCATKQAVSQDATEQQTIEMIQQEEQQIQNDVNAEPIVTPTETEPVVETVPPATEPAAQPAAEPATPPAKATVEHPRPVHPQPVEYTVTAGDSVSALAVRFNVRKADILALNPSLRKNPNSIYIGQKVKLPSGTDVTVKPKPRKVTPAEAAPKGTTTYTVKAGDVLGGIALRHGVSVADIKKANKLKGDTIWVGQKLVIPGAKKKPAAAPAKKPAPVKKPAAETKKAEPAQEKPAEPVVEPVVEEVAPPAPEAEPVAAGNDALGLPPPPPPVVAEAPETETFDYVVGAGEDLVSISFKWGVSISTIRALNNLDESQENAVAPGTTLKLPKMKE